MADEYRPKIYAVAYARVSTEDHDQDPESQLVKIRSYAKDKGITILEEFTDKSTGTNAQRQGLTSMVGWLQMNAMYLDPGKVSRVIVLDTDRLSRNMKDMPKILELFDRLAVTITYVANDSLDMNTPEGQLINSMKTYQAQGYTDGHSLKIKSGIQKARDRGVRLGRPSKMPSDKMTVETLLLLADNGYSMKDIGDMRGCSRMTVSRRLAKENKLQEFKERYEVAVSKKVALENEALQRAMATKNSDGAS